MPLKDSWLFPAIQSIHLTGIALLVGSTVILDLRLLGVALDRHTVEEVAKRFAPWSRAGLAILLITGPVLFVSNVPRYIHNPAFIFKMIVLTLALIFHLTMRKVAEEHGTLAAIISIALWTCVVLGGRAIADFDI